jgi:hypothetical protein
MMHSLAHGPRSGGVRAFRVAGMVVIGVLIALLFALIFGFAVKALWNWLMPEVFGLGAITYWQAFGVLVLGRLIFGGPHASHHRPARPLRDRLWRRHGMPHGCGDAWQFEEFWREEGRAAFDNYMKRVDGVSEDQG